MTPQTAVLSRSQPAHASAAPNLPGALFAGLVLVSIYDKSGVIVGIGGRSISVSFYKVLFAVLILVYLADTLLFKQVKRVEIDRRLYWTIIAFILTETVASSLGLIVASGEFVRASDMYFLLQRLNFLMIPLLAMKYKFSPPSVLKLFLGTIAIHYVFIAFQFVAPDGYGAFVDLVADQLREDTSRGWSSETMSLNFVGLQHTANYGVFGAAFGLLVLGLQPKGMIGRFLKLTVVTLAVLMVLTSTSRAVLLMSAVALLVFSVRTGLLSRAQSFGVMVLLCAVVAGMFQTGVVAVEDLASIYRLANSMTLEADPEDVAVARGQYDESMRGKLLILKAAPEMISRSPIVGWGNRPYLEMARETIGDAPADYSHSSVLSIVLTSGFVGLSANLVMFVGIARALWRRKERDYAIVCGMFIGLGLYSVVYDARHLDVFACFNGVAAYYALRSPVSQTNHSPTVLLPAVAQPSVSSS